MKRGRATRGARMTNAAKIAPLTPSEIASENTATRTGNQVEIPPIGVYARLPVPKNVPTRLHKEYIQFRDQLEANRPVLTRKIWNSYKTYEKNCDHYEKWMARRECTLDQWVDVMRKNVPACILMHTREKYLWDVTYFYPEKDGTPTYPRLFVEGTRGKCPFIDPNRPKQQQDASKQAPLRKKIWCECCERWFAADKAREVRLDLKVFIVCLRNKIYSRSLGNAHSSTM